MYTFTTQTDTPKPYGSINMSRIKDILLQINMSPLNQSKLVKICAVNYNILRVENGMAGVMFNSGSVSIPNK
jgi:hypothetical protein